MVVGFFPADGGDDGNVIIVFILLGGGVIFPNKTNCFQCVNIIAKAFSHPELCCYIL